MPQSFQGVRYTKPKRKSQAVSSPASIANNISIPLPNTSSNKIDIIVDPISKLYTNNMGRFV